MNEQRSPRDREQRRRMCSRKAARYFAERGTIGEPSRRQAGNNGRGRPGAADKRRAGRNDTREASSSNVARVPIYEAE